MALGKALPKQKANETVSINNIIAKQYGGAYHTSTATLVRYSYYYERASEASTRVSKISHRTISEEVILSRRLLSTVSVAL